MRNIRSIIQNRENEFIKMCGYKIPVTLFVS